jgi:hypothetical protein
MKPTKFAIVRNNSKKQERFQSLCNQHEMLKGRLNEVTTELDAVKADLHAMLDDAGVDSISTPDFSLARAVISRDNFSLSKARPVLGNLLDKFITTTTYRTLKVQQAAVAREEKEAA